MNAEGAMDRRTIGWMVAIFVAALALRLIYTLPRADFPAINDMGVYHQLGAGLASGTGYVSNLEPHFKAWRAPGYPLFLAGAYRLFGFHPAPVMVLQSILGAATCVLILAIGRRVLGRGVGVLAALSCTFNPELVHWTAKFLTETLFVFLVVLFAYSCIWTAGNHSQRKSARAATLTGLCLGAAILVRPNAMLLAPAAVIYFGALWEQPPRRRFIATGLLLIAAVAVLVPWTIRNQVVLGGFVPVATIGGAALYVSTPLPAQRDPRLRDMPVWQILERGLHELPNGYKLSPELFGWPARSALPSDFDEREQSALGRELYLEYATSRPRDFAALVVAKASAILNPLPKRYTRWLHEDYGLGRADVAMRFAATLLFFVTLLFAFLGALVTFRLRSPVILLHGTWLAFVGVQLVFRPALRYWLPGLTVLSLFAAAGILALRGRAWRRPVGGLRSHWPLFVWAGWALVLGANTVLQIFVYRGEAVATEWKRLMALVGLA